MYLLYDADTSNQTVAGAVDLHMYMISTITSTPAAVLDLPDIRVRN